MLGSRSKFFLKIQNKTTQNLNEIREKLNQRCDFLLQELPEKKFQQYSKTLWHHLKDLQDLTNDEDIYNFLKTWMSLKEGEITDEKVIAWGLPVENKGDQPDQYQKNLLKGIIELANQFLENYQNTTVNKLNI